LSLLSVARTQLAVFINSRLEQVVQAEGEAMAKGLKLGEGKFV
jgi:hypothetical protein